MEDTIQHIKKEKVPKHVAVIMDGNGRWAKQKGKIRIFGHKSAITSVRETVEAAAEIGVKYLTLYAFSTENWKRPKMEVDALMTLLVDSLNKELPTLQKNKIKLAVIGDEKKLPENCQKQLKKCIQETAHNNHMTLILALSYSARWEILEAVKNLIKDTKAGKIEPELVNESLFSTYLTTSEYPDPELLIRTSGEQRISNFLLWQLSYSELYFTPKMWPDFRKNDFFEAIIDYQNRERRFGMTSEQTQNVQHA